MSGIRGNPPFSVVTAEQHDVYRTLYDDITNNGIELQYQDRHALGELAVNLVDMNNLRKDITEKGTAMTVEGDKGSTVTKRNPSIDVLQKIQPVVIRLMKEFKMMPNSRKQTISGIIGGGAGDDGWDDV